MSGTTCGTCQRKIPTSPAGLPGKNAYTFLTASFTMPAAAASVTVTVSNAGQFGNRWAVVGQIVFIQGAGFFEVAAIVGTNQLTVTNLGYVGNAAPTSTIGSGGYISPAGPIGATGVAGSNGVNGTARLYELLTTQTTASLSPFQTLASYSVPADTLVNDGDALVINAWMVQSAAVTFPNFPLRRITFAGTSLTLSGGLEPFIVSANPAQYVLTVELIKVTSATALARVRVDGNLSSPAIQYSVSLTGLNFTISNQILLSITQFVASGTELRSFTIDKIAS
jgi:hypothetical protein